MIESNFTQENDLTSPIQTESSVFENSLRPKILADYVGQNTLKNNLRIAIESSKIRKDTLDHILLHGSAGTGKTTLANIIALELSANLKISSGPALEKVSDIASILSNLKENDVLFIDEIHRLKSSVEEVLYTAMEDFAIDIIIGKGPSARAMRINLPKFTLIGATTKISMLSSPLRDRF
jgi:Holliday junction DNA helicase RuvB